MTSELSPASCACGTRPGDGDHAVAVDPELKQSV